MSRSAWEKVAVGYSLFVIVVALWFWARQVGDVVETFGLMTP